MWVSSVGEMVAMLKRSETYPITQWTSSDPKMDTVSRAFDAGPKRYR